MDPTVLGEAVDEAVPSLEVLGRPRRFLSDIDTVPPVVVLVVVIVVLDLVVVEVRDAENKGWFRSVSDASSRRGSCDDGGTRHGVHAPGAKAFRTCDGLLL